MTKFSRAIWTANMSELFERMAYYAIFIVITLYLSNTLGFNDIEASLISGLFSGGLYFLPMFTGAFADKIGYRKAILIAFTLLTITVMMIAGIAVQALAECFISPRYMEFFSLQAPKGEEGLYLGFSHLHSFLASVIGFGLSGILLTAYCPDPALYDSVEAWKVDAANAHYIWYWFTGIGAISAIALIIYAKATKSGK